MKTLPEHSLISALAILLLLLVLSLALASSPALASSTAGYELSWWTLDSGGAIAAVSSVYKMDTTIGQADANAPALSGAYLLAPGFWPGGAPRYRSFLPLTLKQ